MGNSEEHSRVLKMSSLLDILWSTVNGFIGKSKHLGKVATHLRSRRPCKVTWVLRHIVYKSYQCSADSTAEELQTLTGINMSTDTVWRELHGKGFHAEQLHASLKSTSTTRSMGWSVVKHAATGLWRSGNLFWWANHTFLVGSLMDDFECFFYFIFIWCFTQICILII